jgi:protein-tyrosine-phosphatase
VSVASAGLLPGGYGSPPEVVATMAEWGIDVSRHRSTQVSAELVAASDVVLTMGRRHAREVVLIDADAWGRTFTLKEFVRRGEMVGRRRPDDALGSWLDRLHHGRRRTDLVGSADSDDVADPIGGPPDGYRRTARLLAGLVEDAASLLWVPRGIRTPPG